MAPGSDRRHERATMVERQLRRRGIRDPRVLEAFAAVPREAFVEAADEASAYEDRPLPIGAGQTISQPFVVALMIEALALRPTDRALEVGAGSGYAAAIMSRLAAEVYALERHPTLAAAAREHLRRLGYGNVTVGVADGRLGLPAAAPFDAVLVSAAGSSVPEALLTQLAPAGRLVMPVGGRYELRVERISRSAAGVLEREDLGGVVFVPLLADVEVE
ncbi:MAG: protein-L-isoaspartate(D-aspartate) O-methyltransferase [Candidatus Limnocylindrales bacterium]